MARRAVHSLIPFMGVVGAVFACGRPDAMPGAESAAAESAAAAPAAAVGSPWVDELGLVLVVPSDSENVGIVLFPEAPTARLVSSAPVMLIDVAGDSSVTRAALAAADSQMCGEAAAVRFSGPVTVSWSVGLMSTSVTPLRMDSIESLPAADSSRFTAELARLASSVPMDRDSRFKGLPFAVLSARRFEAQGRHTIVAHVVRRLPQEAAPLEEHTLIIGERVPAAPSAAPFTLVHHQRSHGSEETAEHYEPLAAFAGRQSTLLLIARDQDAQTIYEILERANNGGWRSRWSRVLTC